MKFPPALRLPEGWAKAQAYLATDPRLLQCAGVIGSFTILYVAIFSPVLFSSRLLAPGDASLYFVPNFLRQKSLWNPLIWGGYPSFADPQVMRWYPLSLLLSPFRAWNAFVLSAYVLASSFTYGYVFEMTRSKLSAAFSGVVYGMCGFMMAHLGHISIIHATPWLPLQVWALERLRRKISPLWFAILGISVACCILGGHLQISAYILALGGAYALVHCWKAPSGTARFFLTYAGGVALGVVLAAIQLIPTLELSSLSLRAEMTFQEFVSYSLPIRQLTLLFFPMLYGGPVSGLYKVPYFGIWNFGEMSFYAGLLPLMMVFCAVLLRRRDRNVLFWFVLALLALWISLGDATPLAEALYRVPLYNKFRGQARHSFEFAFCIAVLAGLGLDAVRRHPEPWRVMRTAVAGVCGLLILGAGLAFGFRDTGIFVSAGVDTYSALLFSTAVLVPVIVLLAGVAAVLLWSRHIHSRVAMGVVLLVLVLDLASFGWFCEWNVISPHRNRFDPPASATKYREILERKTARMTPLLGTHESDQGLRPCLSSLWNVPSASGYSPLMLERTSRFLQMEPAGRITGDWASPVNRALDLFAVRYVFLPTGYADPLPIRSEKGMAWLDSDMRIVLCSGNDATFTFSTPVPATTVGVVSALHGATGFGDGVEVMDIVLTDVKGESREYPLRAGEHTSEWAYENIPEKHSRAPIFKNHTFYRNRKAQEWHQYLGKIRIDGKPEIRSIRLKWKKRRGCIEIFKITLQDESTMLSRPLSQAMMHLVSGRWLHIEDIQDTSVYENVDAMRRVWLVPEVVRAPSEVQLTTIQTSRFPDGGRFNPTRKALVEEELDFRARFDPDQKARIVQNLDTLVEITTSSAFPSFLVLSDTYYPGWKAMVDEVESHVYKTNYLMRGVKLPPGNHVVTFEFRPRRFYVGAAVSGAGLALILCLFGWQGFGFWKRLPRTESFVQQQSN